MSLSIEQKLSQNAAVWEKFFPLLQIKFTWLTGHQQTWVTLQNICFCTFLVWSIQVCVNTMPRRKDISSDLTEAFDVAHQSGIGYEVIYKQSGVHHSTMRNIILKWKTFWIVVSLFRRTSQQVHAKVRLYNVQRNYEKPKSYISDSTGLS